MGICSSSSSSSRMRRRAKSGWMDLGKGEMENGTKNEKEPKLRKCHDRMWTRSGAQLRIAL